MSESISVSGTPADTLPPIQPIRSPFTALQFGMMTVMCFEGVLFITFLIAYTIYLGEGDGPTPTETLSLPLALLNSVFLLSSSATIWLGTRAFSRANHAGGLNEGDGPGAEHSLDQPVCSKDTSGYTFWILVTIALGGVFLLGTAYEWSELIFEHGVTISSSLFGTTFFTLIGCHALHVIVGLSVMALLIEMNRRRCLAANSEGPELMAWYWHFVDAVWVVIVLVVYVFGR